MNPQKQPASIPLRQGRPKETKRCEKKGYHIWKPGRLIVDKISGEQKMAVAKGDDATHRVCMRCGLCKPKDIKLP